MSNFKEDFKTAVSVFLDFKSEISGYLKSDIYSFEGEDNQILNLFDKYAGVDAMQIIDEKVRLLALRFQKDKGYRTFTIRLSRPSGQKTEYEKRVEAIFTKPDEGYVYPYLTLQGYYKETTSGRELTSLAAIPTKDLYNYLITNLLSIGRNKAPDGNTFLYVGFDALKAAGARILICENGSEINSLKGKIAINK